MHGFLRPTRSLYNNITQILQGISIPTKAKQCIKRGYKWFSFHDSYNFFSRIINFTSFDSLKIQNESRNYNQNWVE